MKHRRTIRNRQSILSTPTLFGCILVIVLLFFGPIAQSKDSRGWKAGVAKIVITPDEPTWMAGYASRNKPSEGKVHDLYARAVAIEDAKGMRIVLVTTDLIGFPRALAEGVAKRAEKQFRLPRNQLLLTSTHTHTGPVLAQSLRGSYDLTVEQISAIEKHTASLQDKVVTVIGSAISRLAPATLSFGRSAAHFGVNRREPTPTGVRLGINKEGPVDPDVPVLAIESAQGRLSGVIFSYACHNTTLSGDFYQFCGDYSGFAQQTLENSYPETTALFVMGCGGDINPQPRGQLQFAAQHGEALAQSVKSALGRSTKPVRGRLKARLERFNIPLAPAPSREQFQARLSDKDVFVRRHAERMLARLDRDGKLLSKYPYAVQVIQFGEGLTLVALAGEVVVDYALRLKRELGEDGLWVAAYSNDVFAYIPTARILKEGGYEPERSMIYYDLPGPFSPEVEQIIVEKVHRLVRRARR